MNQLTTVIVSVQALGIYSAADHKPAKRTLSFDFVQRRRRSRIEVQFRNFVSHLNDLVPSDLTSDSLKRPLATRENRDSPGRFVALSKWNSYSVDVRKHRFRL